jgi:hypothetical protein
MRMIMMSETGAMFGRLRHARKGEREMIEGHHQTAASGANIIHYKCTAEANQQAAESK